MSKNIQTHEAKIDLVRKFLDYANIADASYVMLHYVLNGEIKYKKDGKEILEQVDTQKLGSTYFNKDTNTEQNSTYARAIEARFNEDKVGNWCIPFTNKCLTEKDKIDNNDIAKVKLDSKLSNRTIDFTNRFKLLKHQPNEVRTRGDKDSDGNYGFSATLFGEKRKQKNTESKLLKELQCFF